MRSKLEPLGEAQGLGDRLGVLGEARGHRLRARPGPRLALPRRCGSDCLQRRPEPHRDEGVLQVSARRGVGVDVAGRDAGHAEPLGERGEPAVAGAVVPPVGPLQLDPEAVAAEGGEQARGRAAPRRAVAPLPGPGERSLARAAGEADQALGVLLDLLQRHLRLRGARARVVAGMGVGRGEQPAEVAVAGRVFDEEGEVDVASRGSGRSADRLHGQLRPGDRPHAEALAGLRRTPSSPRPRRGR